MAVKKIGISIDEQTYEAVKKIVKEGEFRNLSHFFERAAQLLIREKSQENGAITVSEIVRLKRAGLSEQTIQMVIKEGSFLKNTEPIVYGKSIRPIKLTTAEDLISLKQAGISDDVIKAIIVFGSKDINDSERTRAWDILTNMGILVDMRGKE